MKSQALDQLKRILTALLLGGMFFLLIKASCAEAQQTEADTLKQKSVPPQMKADTTMSRQLRTKSPTGAMLRSLVFPGWGQWYNEKKLKALVVFAAETGLVANSIYLNQKLAASTTELEREYYRDNRNLSNWWLVAVVLLSLADAYVDAHLFNFDESPDLTVKLNRNQISRDREPNFLLCLVVKL